MRLYIIFLQTSYRHSAGKSAVRNGKIRRIINKIFLVFFHGFFIVIRQRFIKKIKNYFLLVFRNFTESGLRKLLNSRAVRFTHQGKELSLAFCKVRIKSSAFGNIFRSASVKIYSVRREFFQIFINAYQLKIFIFRKKSVNIFFVFFKRKRAGGIEQKSADFQHTFDLVENFVLPFGTAKNIFNAPLGLSVFVLAEHSLARTRSINNHKIKYLTEKRGKLFCVGTGCYNVFVPHSLNVARESFTA